MSRKHHKPKKSPVLEYRVLPLDELRRRIAGCDDGHLRAAIEMAKECQRREPTASHAKMLGELYLKRGRQLIAKNQYSEALMVLGNALGLGLGSAELLQAMFECGLRSRQYEMAIQSLRRLDDSPQRELATKLLADEVVARGDELGRLCDPAIREDAARIRRAFAAFERGDDEVMAVELKPIGLRNPCAGWKWLLRGLAAHAAGDTDTAVSCWGRAGPDGRPGRLGNLLRSTVSTDHDGAASSVESLRMRAKTLSSVVDHRVALLEKIRIAMAGGDQETVVLDACARLLAEVDPAERPKYANRLARAVSPILKPDQDLVARFRRLFGEFPEDPGFHRTLALWGDVHEPGETIALWRYCLRVIETTPSIPAHLRDRAQAMLCERIGDVQLKIEEYSRPLGFTARFFNQEPSEAVEWYRKAVRSFPGQLSTQEKLLNMLVKDQQAAEAEKQAVQIVARWPDHVPSLLFIGKQCLDRHAYRKALGFFQQAQAVEPFNRKVRDSVASCFLKSARRRQEQGKLELARQDYRQAEAVYPAGECPPYTYAKWAAMECRLSNSALADELVEQAFAAGHSRVAVCFNLVVEMDRAGVPAPVRQRFDDLLATAWQGAPTAAAAVEMARLMLALDDQEVEVGCWDDLARGLERYIERASSGVDFSEGQLGQVCAFLAQEGAWKTLERLATQGLKRFPDQEDLLLQLAQAQMALHKGRLPRATRKQLRKAGQKAADEGRMEFSLAVMALLEQADSPSWFGRGATEPSLAGLLEILMSSSDDDAAEEEELPPGFFRRIFPGRCRR